MTHHPTPLKFLMPGWFVIIMGLSGLTLAWHNAAPLLGQFAVAVARGLGWLTAGLALVLAVLSLVRWQRYPQAVYEDVMHPVRHVFVAAMPISLILLATVATALSGPSRAVQALWLLGSVWQFGVTAWALSRWLALPMPPGIAAASQALWPSITPALLIPVVGNVLAPLAGVALGLPAWSAAQMGVGLLLWPVVLTLMVVRVGVACAAAAHHLHHHCAACRDWPGRAATGRPPLAGLDGLGHGAVFLAVVGAGHSTHAGAAVWSDILGLVVSAGGLQCAHAALNAARPLAFSGARLGPATAGDAARGRVVVGHTARPAPGLPAGARAGAGRASARHPSCHCRRMNQANSRLIAGKIRP